MANLIYKLKNLIFTLSLLFFSLTAHAHYAIYIDAGSSGSRLYLYQYEASTSLPSIKMIFSKKVTPGLSSFRNNPEKVNTTIMPLLDSVTNLLKEVDVTKEKIELNLLSTAGMRLLTKEQQNKIYTKIKNFIEKNYNFSVREIKTISGKEEGLYGWLTINYLEQTFQKGLPTLGSIDMGNASTQITHAVEKDNLKEMDSLIHLTINKKDYQLISNSFLGLGLLEARQAMGIANKNITSCYPNGYPINSLLTGKFNVNDCSNLYLQVIKDRIIISKPYPKGMKFIAYSGIYGPLHFLTIDKEPTEKNMVTAIQNTCSKSWETFINEYSQKEPANYLPYYCTDAIYIKELIYSGYQLAAHPLQVAQTIKEVKIAWPLGALLHRIIVQS